MIHNFAQGTKETYYGLGSNKVRVVTEAHYCAFHGGFGGARVRVFIEAGFSGWGDLGAEDVVFSPYPIKGLIKRREVLYLLDSVMDPKAYRDSKQRYNRMVAPFKSSISVSLATRREGLEILSVYERWVSEKRNDPEVHQITFTSGRYRRCVELGLMNPDLYRVFKIVADSKIVGARVLSVEGAGAYDLAFFVDTERAPSQTSNNASFLIAHALYTQGVKFINSGDSLNRKLHQFKAHYPHQYVYFWSGKVKNVQTV